MFGLRLRFGSRTLFWLLVLAIAGAGLVYVVVFIVPPRVINSSSVPDAAVRLKLQNDVRATLLQALAGALFLVTAFLTWQQLHVSREGQITDRFTRAIDQLGSDKLPVRLGGIYALERIARDSASDRGTITEVLTAFVRQRAPWPPSSDSTFPADYRQNDLPALPARMPDVHAVLDLLGRQNAANSGHIRLNGSDLRNASIAGNFRNAIFYRSNLRASWMGRIDLSGANLAKADLRDSHLIWADLSRASIDSTDFRGATFSSEYSSIRLSGAIATSDTRWPEGFNWREAGVRFARVEERGPGEVIIFEDEFAEEGRLLNDGDHLDEHN
jgi:hypothetical protein